MEKLRKGAKSMVITTIAEENRAAFERFMPDNLSVRLNREGWFGLGGIHTADGENRAAGALVFNIEEGSNGDENLTAAQVQWLYVAEKFRRQGIAEALLRELFRVLEQASIAHILCDIPMDAEYNELCAYLESWGFTVSLTDVYEAELTAADFASHPAVKNGGTADGAVPLSKVPDTLFRQYLNKMKRLPYVPDSLSEETGDYDETVSCVCRNNGAIEGALLVQRQAEDLEVVHFRTINYDSPAMLRMFRYAVRAAVSKYSMETRVHIVIRSPAAAETLDKLFPGLSPRLVRRAYYSVYELPEESVGGVVMDNA